MGKYYFDDPDPLPPDVVERVNEARAVLKAVERMQAEGISFEQAIARPANCFSPSALARRDKLIAELVVFYTGTATGVARAIAVDAELFSLRTWPAVKDNPAYPETAKCRADAIFWQLHDDCRSGGAKWPLGERHLLTVTQSLALGIAR